MNHYTTHEMSRVWSDTAMVLAWRDVELAILEAQAHTGLVPAEWHDLAAQHYIDMVQWREQTEQCGHEVVGFLRAWDAPHAHIGVTSSDITDTALSIRIKRTNEILADGVESLISIVRDWVDSTDFRRLGRTHGQAAAPMEMSQVFANWWEALSRHRTRLESLRPQIEVAMVSGPVGSYLHTTPEVEAIVSSRLGLMPCGVSTQIMMRDGIAAWVAELGTLASVIEAMALELRLMAHDSVGEACEHGGSSSSAMPHKLNPNRLERLCGLARVVRSAYEPVAAGVAQWHERDMAHSSVERIYLPQVACTVDYMIDQIAGVLDRLDIDPLTTMSNLMDRSVESSTHSVQTALQLAGYTHRQAQEHTQQIYRSCHNMGEVRRAVEDLGATWIQPTPNTSHLLED